MDKSGRAMLNSNTLGLYFDEVTKSVNRAGKGSKVSADYLTSLAEQDLPKALELLSKLYVSGEVTGATLKKIFSERHFNPIAVGLIQMNGDIDAFNKNLTAGYKVIDGYNLQMQSMTNQVELAKNNFSALKGVLFEGMKGGLLPFVFIINQMGVGLIEVNKQVPILSAALATTATYLGIIAGSSAIKHIFNYVLLLGKITPMVAGISVAISALVGGFSYLNKIKTDRLALISISDKNISDAEKFKEQAKSIGLEIDILNKSLSTLGTQNITTALERQQEIWDRYAKSVGVSNSAMTELLKTLREISKIDPLKSMNEADIAKKKLNILESGKKSAESLVATSGETPSSNIKFSIAERLLKPERENVALFTPKESDALAKALQEGNGKIDGTKLKWVDKIIEAQKLNAGDSDIALARLVKGGATKQDFDLVSGLDKFAKSYHKTIEEILTTKNGKGYYGKELEAVITLNKSSQEYANYVQNIKTSASYDPKIEQTKLEYETYITQELQKQVEAAQELKQLSKDKIMDLDVEDLKNIKNFKEYEKFLNKISGLDISKYISKDVYNKISNQTDFDTSKLNTAPVQGKIIDINETRQAVAETKKLLNQNYSKVKIRGLSDIEMKATKDAILSQESAIASSEELIKRLINTLSIDLLEVADKANKSLVSIDFKTIKSNVEELTNELKSLGLNGLDLVNAKSTNLFKNYKSNESELINSLQLLGGSGATTTDEAKYSKIKSDIESTSTKNPLTGVYEVSPDVKDKYDNAVKQLENLNALKELGIKYDIEANKLDVEKNNEKLKSLGIQRDIAKQIETIKNIGKEVTLNDELQALYSDKIALNENSINMSQSEYTKAYGDINVKIAQAEYNAKMKTNKLLFDSFKTQQDMKTYGYELNAQQEYKNEMLLIQKQRSLDLITDKEYELAKEKAQNDLIKERINLNKQLYGDIASNIDKISKGEFSSTPSYDLSGVTGKLANRKEFGKTDLNKFTGKDYAQMANFAITQFSNVWGTINSKHIESINNEITMLDMRKELATSDEERQRIDKEILDKKIEVIKLESQTKQQQSIMGGITGGLTTMMQNPSILGAGLGLLQMGMGIFGASEERKKAKIQEKQLKEQERIRIEAEKQSKLLEQQKQFYQTWLQYSFSGVTYGLEKAFQKTGFTTQGGVKSSTYSEFKTNKEQNYMDYIAKGKETDEAMLNWAKNNPTQIKSDATLEEIKARIAELATIGQSMISGSPQTTAQGRTIMASIEVPLNLAIQTGNLGKINQEYLKKDEEYIEQNKIIYSNYFDWELKQIEKTGLYEKESWKKREDIMNQVVENAKTGANTIAEYMGGYVTSSIISAWTRNRTSLNTILTDIQTNVSNLSDYMANNLGKNLDDLFKDEGSIEYYAKLNKAYDYLLKAIKSNAGTEEIKTLTQNIKDIQNMSFQSHNKYLTPLINNFKSLNDEQVEINKQSSYLVKTWIALGGAVSDVMSMLPQFSKDLYNAIGGALTQNNFIDRFNSIGEVLSSSIIEKMKKNLLDNSLKGTFETLNDQITAIMTGGETSISDVVSLRSAIEKSAASMQRESEKVKSITDLLNMSNEVQYTSSNSQIQYSSGTTNQNTYNISNQIQMDIGNILMNTKEDRIAIARNIGAEVLDVIESKIGKLKK